MPSVDTYGGTFNNDALFETYTAGHLRGCRIKLIFTPNELVRSPKIGLTQSIKAQRSGNADYEMGGPQEQTERQGRANTAAQGDEGRHMDRFEGRSSPMYGMENPAAGHTALGASAAQDNAHWGKRVVKPDGSVDSDPAWLTDRPALVWSAGQTLEQRFETTALSVEGVQSGTYYGSVEWGVTTDATGTPSLINLRLISMGAPTGDFMTSAQNWNDTTVQIGGTATDTQNLPITTHHTADPSSLNEQQLEARMRQLAGEILRMDRKSPDYQNKRFEIRGLSREAIRRGTGSTDSGHRYTVRAGDTLWDIAAKTLGSGARWTKIFMLNCIELGNPNLIHAGQVLHMPVPFNPGGAAATGGAGAGSPAPAGTP